VCAVGPTQAQPQIHGSLKQQLVGGSHLGQRLVGPERGARGSRAAAWRGGGGPRLQQQRRHVESAPVERDLYRGAALAGDGVEVEALDLQQRPERPVGTLPEVPSPKPGSQMKDPK